MRNSSSAAAEDVVGSFGAEAAARASLSPWPTSLQEPVCVGVSLGVSVCVCVHACASAHARKCLSHAAAVMHIAQLHDCCSQAIQTGESAGKLSCQRTFWPLKMRTNCSRGLTWTKQQRKAGATRKRVILVSPPPAARGQEDAGAVVVGASNVARNLQQLADKRALYLWQAIEVLLRYCQYCRRLPEVFKQVKLLVCV